MNFRNTNSVCFSAEGTTSEASVAPVATAVTNPTKPVKAASKKASKKVAKTAKKPAKKANKPSTPRGPSVRERALKALKSKDLTASEVQAAIGLGHGLKPTLDQEVTRGHLSYAPSKDESNIAVYHLTAAGKKSLENGTVNPPRESKAPAKKVAKKAKK